MPPVAARLCVSSLLVSACCDADVVAWLRTTTTTHGAAARPLAAEVIEATRNTRAALDILEAKRSSSYVCPAHAVLCSTRFLAPHAHLRTMRRRSWRDTVAARTCTFLPTKLQPNNHDGITAHASGVQMCPWL